MDTLTITNGQITGNDLEIDIWLPTSNIADYTFSLQPINLSKRTAIGRVNVVLIFVSPNVLPDQEMPAATSVSVGLKYSMLTLNNDYMLGAEHVFYEPLIDDCMVVVLHESPNSVVAIAQVFDEIENLFQRVSRPGRTPFRYVFCRCEEGKEILGSPKRAGISIVTK